MPELIEVEQYRAALDPLCGQTVESITFSDRQFVRPRGTPVEVFGQVVGNELVATSRRGKLLLVHISNGLGDAFVVGMRFGMTGRLLIDGVSPIENLEYASARNDPAWDRAVFVIGGKRVSIRDQRRLGSVELDPDIEALGVEATLVAADQLEALCSGRTKAIKALLLDQQLLAGLGNLLADETLWQAEIAPHRSAGALSPDECKTLAHEIQTTVKRLSTRGGSHTGDSFPARRAGALCPRCTGQMEHRTVGGRSTWWCAAHQR